MIKNRLILKFILSLLFMVAVLLVYYQYKEWRHNKRAAAMNNQIGKKFVLNGLEDSSGTKSTINFKNAEYNIVDFWFKSCPSCIVEMKQFETLLKGKEKSVSITSISIDDFYVWKDVLQGKHERLSFIAKPVSNWHHLILQVPDQIDKSAYEYNANLLNEKFGITSYPGVFVVDKEGVIIAAPESAVPYIKTNLTGKNGFLVFLTSVQTWTSLKTWALLILSFTLFDWVFKTATKNKKS